MSNDYEADRQQLLEITQYIQDKEFSYEEIVAVFAAFLTENYDDISTDEIKYMVDVMKTITDFPKGEV